MARYSKPPKGYWAYMDLRGQMWSFKTKKRATMFARAGREKNWSKKIVFMPYLNLWR